MSEVLRVCLIEAPLPSPFVLIDSSKAKDTFTHGKGKAQ